MTTEQVRELFFPVGARFSRAEDRAFARESLIYNVTEDLLVLMEQQGVSRKELARRLGRSRSCVTQLLSGARNMTLGTLSDICFALGTEPRVSVAGEGADMRFDGANWEETLESTRAACARSRVLSSRSVIDRQASAHWVNEAA